jgi:hypothetical protein
MSDLNRNGNNRDSKNNNNNNNHHYQNKHLKTTSNLNSKYFPNIIARGWLTRLKNNFNNYNFIGDLNDHVRKTWRRNEYLKATIKFGGSSNNGDKILENFRQSNNDHVMMMIITQGYLGSYASGFVNEVCPYELYTMREFQEQDYESALKKLFINVHNELVNSKVYKCEENYPRASGTSANIVLITQHTTYFASLGNSPILLHTKLNDVVRHIGGIHNQCNVECVDKINESKIPTLQEIDHSNLFSVSTGGFNENIASLGDALYDMKVFNALIREIEEFKRFCETENVLEKLKKHDRIVEAFGNFLSDKDPNDYPGYLKKILSFGEDNIFLKGLLTAEKSFTNITMDPIYRHPHVVKIDNDDICGFALVTNSVVKDKAYHVAEPSFNKILFNYKTSNFHECFEKATSLSRPPHTQDRCGILVWYNYKQDKYEYDIKRERERERERERDHNQQNHHFSNNNNNINRYSYTPQIQQRKEKGQGQEQERNRNQSYRNSRRDQDDNDDSGSTVHIQNQNNYTYRTNTNNTNNSNYFYNSNNNNKNGNALENVSRNIDRVIDRDQNNERDDISVCSRRKYHRGSY